MKNQQGFTLIEIIAVLVILGILAAVAIPKYQDMQQTARERGAQGIVAGVLSALSLQYSKALLDGTPPGDITVTPSWCTSQVAITGDYTITTCGGDLATTVNIGITHPVGGTDFVTETWTSPEQP